jgi:uncharacterized membrane protein YsdA (DUF1294 family)
MDKSRARKGMWRIPEQTLLNWAFIGGSAGAYLGRGYFRHKTCKQPFVRSLHIITIMQMMIIIFGFVYWMEWKFW